MTSTGATIQLVEDPPPRLPVCPEYNPEQLGWETDFSVQEGFIDDFVGHLTSLIKYCLHFSDATGYNKDDCDWSIYPFNLQQTDQNSGIKSKLNLPQKPFTVQEFCDVIGLFPQQVKAIPKMGLAEGERIISVIKGSMSYYRTLIKHFQEPRPEQNRSVFIKFSPEYRNLCKRIANVSYMMSFLCLWVSKYRIIQNYQNYYKIFRTNADAFMKHQANLEELLHKLVDEEISESEGEKSLSEEMKETFLSWDLAAKSWNTLMDSCQGMAGDRRQGPILFPDVEEARRLYKVFENRTHGSIFRVSDYKWKAGSNVAAQIVKMDIFDQLERHTRFDGTFFNSKREEKATTWRHIVMSTLDVELKFTLPPEALKYTSLEKEFISLKISEPILKDSSRNYEEIWWITAFNKTFGEQDENLTQDEKASQVINKLIVETVTKELGVSTGQDPLPKAPKSIMMKLENLGFLDTARKELKNQLTMTALNFTSNVDAYESLSSSESSRFSSPVPTPPPPPSSVTITPLVTDTKTVIKPGPTMAPQNQTTLSSSDDIKVLPKSIITSSTSSTTSRPTSSAPSSSSSTGQPTISSGPSQLPSQATASSTAFSTASSTVSSIPHVTGAMSVSFAPSVVTNVKTPVVTSILNPTQVSNAPSMVFNIPQTSAAQSSLGMSGPPHLHHGTSTPNHSRSDTTNTDDGDIIDKIDRQITNIRRMLQKLDYLDDPTSSLSSKVELDYQKDLLTKIQTKLDQLHDLDSGGSETQWDMIEHLDQEVNLRLKKTFSNIKKSETAQAQRQQLPRAVLQTWDGSYSTFQEFKVFMNSMLDYYSDEGLKLSTLRKNIEGNQRNKILRRIQHCTSLEQALSTLESFYGTFNIQLPQIKKKLENLQNSPNLDGETKNAESILEFINLLEKHDKTSIINESFINEMQHKLSEIRRKEVSDEGISEYLPFKLFLQKILKSNLNIQLTKPSSSNSSHPPPKRDKEIHNNAQSSAPICLVCSTDSHKLTKCPLLKQEKDYSKKKQIIREKSLCLKCCKEYSSTHVCKPMYERFVCSRHKCNILLCGCTKSRTVQNNTMRKSTEQSSKSILLNGKPIGGIGFLSEELEFMDRNGRVHTHLVTYDSFCSHTTVDKSLVTQLQSQIIPLNCFITTKTYLGSKRERGRKTKLTIKTNNGQRTIESLVSTSYGSDLTPITFTIPPHLQQKYNLQPTVENKSGYSKFIFGMEFNGDFPEILDHHDGVTIARSRLTGNLIVAGSGTPHSTSNELMCNKSVTSSVNTLDKSTTDSPFCSWARENENKVAPVKNIKATTKAKNTKFTAPVRNAETTSELLVTMSTAPTKNAETNSEALDTTSSAPVRNTEATSDALDTKPTTKESNVVVAPEVMNTIALKKKVEATPSSTKDAESNASPVVNSHVIQCFCCGNIVSESDAEVIVQSNVTSPTILKDGKCHKNEKLDKYYQNLTTDSINESPLKRCIQCKNCPTCKNFTREMPQDLEQEKLEELMINAVTFNHTTKRYCISYPKNQLISQLPDNEKPALAVMKSLEKDLMKKPVLLDQFNAGVVKQIEAGVFVPASSVQGIEDLQRSYIVLTYSLNKQDENNVPKLRICTNSSFRSPSFNACCLTCPSYLQKLEPVLTRWRCHTHFSYADIKAAYNQCEVSLADANLRRMWLKDGGLGSDGEWKPYLMMRANFGDVLAGPTCTVAINDAIRSSLGTDFMNAVKENTVMDDIAVLDSDKDSLTEKQTKIEAALLARNLPIKPWISSYDDISPLKYLSYMYEPRTDRFRVRVRVNLSPSKRGARQVPDITHEDDIDAHVLTYPWSRRRLSGATMMTHDPLNIISPVSNNLKFLLREVTELKYDWDDPLEPSLAARCTAAAKLLLQTRTLSFPRQCLFPQSISTTFDIYIDGSMQNVSSVIMVLSVLPNNTQHYRMLKCKSKLTSKDISHSARSELSSCLLGSRMLFLLKNDLQTFLTSYGGRVKYRIISDSSIVLGQVSKDYYLFKQWVSVRIQEIQTLVGSMNQTVDFLHCCSNDNISDAATRFWKKPVSSIPWVQDDLPVPTSIKKFYPETKDVTDLLEYDKKKIQVNNLFNHQTVQSQSSSDHHPPHTHQLVQSKSPVKMRDLMELAMIQDYISENDKNVGDGNSDGHNVNDDISEGDPEPPDPPNNNSDHETEEEYDVNDVNDNSNDDYSLETMVQKMFERRPGRFFVILNSLARIINLFNKELTWRQCVKKSEKIIFKCQQSERLDFLKKFRGHELNKLVIDDIFYVQGRDTPGGPTILYIVPPNTLLRSCLIKTFHNRNHFKALYVRGDLLRNNYYLTSALPSLKKASNDCSFCKRRERRPLQTRMGPLGDTRLEGSTYLKHGVCDLVGPFKCSSFTHPRSSARKIWLLVIIESWARMVQVYPLSSLSTKSLIDGFTYINYRFGNYETLFSDLGTNLVGYKNQQQQLQQQQQQLEQQEDAFSEKDLKYVKQQLKSLFGTTLMYRVGKSPHIQGSVERINSFIRKSLFQMKASQNLFSWMVTCEKIMFLCNRRPIGLSTSLDYICPESLNFLRSNIFPVDSYEEFINEAEENVRKFSEKWYNLYWSQLFKQKKWFKSDKLENEDILMILDHKNSFNYPTLGRVISIEPGRTIPEDRYYTVEYKDDKGRIRTLKRTSHQLCMILKKNGRLDLEPEEPDDHHEDGGEHDNLDDSPDQDDQSGQDDPGDQEDPGNQEHPDDQESLLFDGDMISGIQRGPFVSSPDPDVLPPANAGDDNNEVCTDEDDMRNMQPLGDDLNEIDIDNIQLDQPNVPHNVIDSIVTPSVKVSFPKRVPLIKDKTISKKKK